MKNLSKLIFILLTGLFSNAIFADEKCNPFKPTFTVGSEEYWQGRSPEAIVQSYYKAVVKNDLYNKKLPLKELISPYSKTGVLVVSVCNGKSETVNVGDLLTSQAKEKKLSLVLARKNFFKLVSGKSSKPILKKVSSIQWIAK